ncbi:MAG: hypothetical protein NTZ35_15480 [Ignavibacteriales bacterium]|nr:hypothetical protein [Ignavibacteriales bacterium]
MTIFLDLAGSLVVRASMVTVMLGLTVTMNNALYETTQRTNATATVAAVGEIMYTDLNEAVGTGFSTSNPYLMVFQADTSDQSTPWTITYDAMETYTRTQWDPVAHQNVDVVLHRLYRQSGSQRVLISDNLQNVQFRYFDSDGQSPSSPGNVNSVRVTLVAKIEGVESGVTTTTIDFRTFPPSLN